MRVQQNSTHDAHPGVRKSILLYMIPRHVD